MPHIYEKKKKIHKLSQENTLGDQSHLKDKMYTLEKKSIGNELEQSCNTEMTKVKYDCLTGGSLVGNR